MRRTGYKIQWVCSINLKIVIFEESGKKSINSNAVDVRCGTWWLFLWCSLHFVFLKFSMMSKLQKITMMPFSPVRNDFPQINHHWRNFIIYYRVPTNHVKRPWGFMGKFLQMFKELHHIILLPHNLFQSTVKVESYTISLFSERNMALKPNLVIHT